MIIDSYVAQGGAPSLTYDYTHALGTGDRTATITVSGMTPSGAGTLDNAVDGGITNNTTDGFNMPLGATLRVINFDFGSAVDFSEFRIQWSSAAASQGNWVMESAPDNATWTDRTAGGFTLGGTTDQTIVLASTTSVRYWRLRQTSGATNSSPRFLEITFKMLG